MSGRGFAAGWRRSRLRQFVKTPASVVALGFLALVVLIAIRPELFAPRSPITGSVDALLRPPGSGYLIGSDELGRDLLSRMIFGARPSLTVASVAVLIAFGVGAPLGLFSGYYANTLLDNIISRIIDTLLAFPVFVVALGISAVNGPGLSSAVVGIGIASLPSFARVARGQTLNERGSEYVLSARAVGVPEARLIFRHIAPNIMPPLIVLASLSAATAVLIEASLSYLGLGIQPPQPSWGAMLRAGVGYLESAPWVALTPGIAIFFLTLALNIVGDGLQRSLNPRTPT